VDDFEKERKASVVFARVSSRAFGVGVVDGVLDD
jgi:hypothetical protein